MSLLTKKIFINYRRDDDQNVVFGIANSLMREYGVDNIFYDRQKIPPTEVFTKKIDSALDDCAILLVIIGKQWMNLLNQRLATIEKDYVILEIERAIQKGKFVLPILLDNTTMPSEIQLPQNIKALSNINAIKFSTGDLHASTKVLIAELNDLLSKKPPVVKPPLVKKRIMAGLSVGIIAIIAVLFFNYFKSGKNEKTPEVLPLTENEFRAKVLTAATFIKDDPLKNSSKQINQLKELIGYEVEHSFYSKNLKTETSILNRIYGAAIILDGQDPNVNPSIYFKEAFPYIKRSFRLEPEIWKQDYDIKAYQLLEGIEKKIDKTDFASMEFIKEYLKSVITVAMYSASSEEINSVVDALLPSIGSLSEVLKFFADYPVGNTNYRLMVESIKMLLLGMGSDLKGPDIIDKGKNTYHINYWLIDKQGTKKFLIWEVDMSRRTVNPFNDDANTFTEAIKNKR